MTREEDKNSEIDTWIHESAIWTSDVDFWLDETQTFQNVLNKAVSMINDDVRLKSLDHLQNIITYYGNEVLIDLKSKIFHHRQHLSASSNGSFKKMHRSVISEHNALKDEVADIERRMKEYKTEFVQLKEKIGIDGDTAYLSLKHILIPTDFSENATRAVDYALSILGKGAKKITLLHAFHTSTPSNIRLDSQDKGAEQVSRERFENELQRISKSFPDLTKKVTTSFRVGKLSQWLGEIVASENVDLIVMGTRGAGKGAFLFGSNTSHIVESILTPILVIPEEAPLLPPRRLMFATDLEAKERPMGMNILKCIAEQYNAKLHVVHVDPKNNPIDSAHVRFDAREALIELGLEGNQVEFVESEDILTGMNDFVKKNMIDIVSTITHHESQFKSLFSGSTTRSMVLHSHIPILVLHGRAMR